MSVTGDSLWLDCRAFGGVFRRLEGQGWFSSGLEDATGHLSTPLVQMANLSVWGALHGAGVTSGAGLEPLSGLQVLPQSPRGAAFPGEEASSISVLSRRGTCGQLGRSALGGLLPCCRAV